MSRFWTKLIVFLLNFGFFCTCKSSNTSSGLELHELAGLGGNFILEFCDFGVEFLFRNDGGPPWGFMIILRFWCNWDIGDWLVPVLARFLRFWLMEILGTGCFFFVSLTGVTWFRFIDLTLGYFCKVGLTDDFFLGVLFLSGGLNLFWYGFCFGANTGLILMSSEWGATIFFWFA